jgi:hypothetical protein
MNRVVCLNGNAPVQDTFAPLAAQLHGEVVLVLKVAKLTPVRQGKASRSPRKSPVCAG